MGMGPAVWMINQRAGASRGRPELTDDERDLMALLILLTPGAAEDLSTLRDLMPVVHLFIHVYADAGTTPGEGIARVEDHGAVTEKWVEALGPHCRFRIQPVIDILGMAPVDAYEIPDRHREAVHLMTPADTFPFGSSLSRKKQVDHTEEYDEHGPPGQSGIGNYGPLTTPHHRIKTHGGWDVKQPFPGIYVWKDEHGAFFLVDNTGTRRLPRQTDALPMVIEIYRDLPPIEWAA